MYFKSFGEKLSFFLLYRFFICPGDILGSLRVRISHPLGKSAPGKLYFILKFYFDLKHPKITTPEGGEAVSTLVLKSMCPVTSQNALLFPELPFYFPELPFHFSELPFYFSKVPLCFPEVPFCFSKMPYCFLELRFSFPEVPSIYLLYVSFSNNSFFQLIVPYPRPAQSCSKRQYLPCSCFVSSSNYLLTNV